MSELNAAEYVERVCNNTAHMIREVTQMPDGSPKGMSNEVTAGVLIAQSNLAIAAALMLVAHEIKEFRP